MNATRTDLRQRALPTPIGVLTLVASDRGLTNILFASEPPEHAGLPSDLPAADDGDETLTVAATQLEEYFAGTRREFDVPLDLVGTEFQRQMIMTEMRGTVRVGFIGTSRNAQSVSRTYVTRYDQRRLRSFQYNGSLSSL